MRIKIPAPPRNFVFNELIALKYIEPSLGRGKQSVTVTYYCCCLVAKSCLTLCNPIDCSLPGSSVHGISPARILEQVAMSFSRGCSQHRNQTCVSCISK